MTRQKNETDTITTLHMINRDTDTRFPHRVRWCKNVQFLQDRF